MKNNEVIFSINDMERIVISLEDDLQNIDCCYEQPILLNEGFSEIVLANIPIYYAMQKFSASLQQALDIELVFHKSIIRDIGYLYNEYSFNKSLEDKSIFVEIVANKKTFWVGYKYYIWSSCLKNSSFATWMYNNRDGFIIFEVTPLYVVYDEEESNYIAYEDWIKNYKPYLIRTLSRETAQQWLEKANYIVEQIDKNIARWRAQIE